MTAFTIEVRGDTYPAEPFVKIGQLMGWGEITIPPAAPQSCREPLLPRRKLRHAFLLRVSRQQKKERMRRERRRRATLQALGNLRG